MYFTTCQCGIMERLRSIPTHQFSTSWQSVTQDMMLHPPGIREYKNNKDTGILCSI